MASISHEPNQIYEIICENATLKWNRHGCSYRDQAGYAASSRSQITGNNDPMMDKNCNKECETKVLALKN